MKYILLMLISLNLNAFELPVYEKLNWNGVDVVYLEDNQVPTYDVIIYFADGSVGDGRKKGATSWMFSNMDLGTIRFNRHQIADALEFYGASWGPHVSHEYSTYHIGGLIKDVVPTVKKICHLFTSATYPKKELRKQKILTKNALNNIINNHAALAGRAFREISLSGTPVKYPSGGKLKDLKRINRRNLMTKLSYFNQKVKKRIYIRGPKSVLHIKNIFNEDCGWSGKANFERKLIYKDRKPKHKITLVTVPKANQSRVLIGRFLNKNSKFEPEANSLLAQVLGSGGFSSLLMKKLRVEHGLTYGAGARVSFQKFYGRAIVQTFTKNENLIKLLKITEELFHSIGKGEFSKEYFANSKNALVGAFPFKFENKNAYLTQLLFLDHVGRPYTYFKDYKNKVSSFSKNKIVADFNNIFSWKYLDIVILGPKSMYKQLKKEFGKVNVVNYKRFL